MRSRSATLMRRARWSRLAAAVALCLLLASCSTSAGGQSTRTNPTHTSPTAAPTGQPARSSGGPICGGLAKPPATWGHVIWIWMENRDYNHVVGSAQAPYENGTLIAGCGLATNYHNITHPSLPNYLAATSGRILAHGDCSPDAYPTTASSLFAQLRAIGKSWRAYQESMPTNCAHTDAGAYAARHNPPVYYTPIAADRWLAAWIPRILASPAYRAGVTVLMLTWDEGDSGGSGDCAANTTAPGCHVATVVVSPSTP